MNYIKRLFINFLPKKPKKLSSYKLEDYYWVVKKKINGQNYYLRFCSTTGEPLWEDRVTRNTETFTTQVSAQLEINNYFIHSIMNKCRPEPVLKVNIPSSYDEDTKSYYGLKQ